ncbi:MAG: hypothetical protein PWP06_1519 [Candidatus Marinimicrobia bacterium]|jgi:hypothetical protein|nr:hypothetical protein [Candidatus Neomarinimicrobiota bacterium]
MNMIANKHGGFSSLNVSGDYILFLQHLIMPNIVVHIKKEVLYVASMG